MPDRDIETERDIFARRQAEMTANWYSGVQKKAGDLDAFIGRRQVAYLDRWGEAARFIPEGATVLDVGGGNTYVDLLKFLKSRAYDYFYLDVDPGAAAASAALAAGFGFDPSQFRVGFNDRLDFADEQFDAVFSSHCIEHSFDLPTTFRELNRVLKPDGNLLMAVPFGWESNPEHPYFFDADDWQALVDDAGFEVRVLQVGREYAEAGFDLFVAARKVGAPRPAFRVDPAVRRKTAHTHVDRLDGSITLTGTVDRRDDHVILGGPDWAIDIAVPAGAREIRPIFARHDWSGIVAMRQGARELQIDLYSWYSYAQPALYVLDPSAPPRLEIRPSGRNPAARDGQVVLYGYMWR
ncbi:class I SAM-dependent methyltransferase [Siculibacillus lacustris]|nr:class I SAM-dependent methyltransferase [Siculibacillus lacustris]